jgi:hypothetical protein
MDPEFVDGLIIKAPRQGAPDFVKGSISIKREELLAWLGGKTDEWINLDIKVSKAGKWYSQVNTWKPEGGAANGGQATPAAATAATPEPQPDASVPVIDYPEGDVNPSDIPF